jgi:hypothetical protein
MVIYFVADLKGVDKGMALFVFDEATLFGSVLCAFTAKKKINIKLCDIHIYIVDRNITLLTLGTPPSSTTKTGRHNMAEILLKVRISTINQSIKYIYNHLKHLFLCKVSFLIDTPC